MYSDVEVEADRRMRERLQRKGVPFTEYAGATEHTAWLAQNYHALDGLPDGRPILCQDGAGNLQSLPGLHYPLRPGN